MKKKNSNQKEIIHRNTQTTHTYKSEAHTDTHKHTLEHKSIEIVEVVEGIVEYLNRILFLIIKKRKCIKCLVKKTKNAKKLNTNKMKTTYKHKILIICINLYNFHSVLVYISSPATFH